jgi:hypothetical protein
VNGLIFLHPFLNEAIKIVCSIKEPRNAFLTEINDDARVLLVKAEARGFLTFKLPTNAVLVEITTFKNTLPLMPKSDTKDVEDLTTADSTFFIVKSKDICVAPLTDATSLLYTLTTADIPVEQLT